MVANILAVGIMEMLASPVGIAAVIVFLLLGTALGYASRYKRCPSNKILVIYGQVKGGRSRNNRLSRTCVVTSMRTQKNDWNRWD